MTINAQSTTAQAVAAAVQSNPAFNRALADHLVAGGKLSADEIKVALTANVSDRANAAAIRAGWSRAAAAANAHFGL
ncbi:hypothetical protein ACFOON_05870 [Novosphingobium piscinae]|uniref:Uncharacterized protein n=1 Tax=Novosphingobium piscinae TaxID=1507448 RepID=A0A7X1KQF1_9SPHN|nr:hypothetical protein [Novosphingobium piscinae]MBC2669656.1 hypothetical protein [Novosphingobium piscinae]